jgi:competence protein ComEA
VPTPAERRALLFVAVVAALGTSVRGVRSLRPAPATVNDRAALADQIARVDSAIASGGRRPSRKGGGAPAATGASVPVTEGDRIPVARSRRPPADPLEALRRDPIDLDRADSAALDRLPGIGPALASRIIADRRTSGPFGSLHALQRVKGVGPALAARLEPLVTFSAASRRSPMEPPPRRADGPIRP